MWKTLLYFMQKFDAKKNEIESLSNSQY